MDNVIAHGVITLLGFVVVPVWLLAGFVDYWCHRYSHIEETSGVRESLLHLIQFGLVGVPLIAALFLAVDAAMLLALLAFIVAHHAIAYMDVRYATRTRDVTPFEQMVHSVLELSPITAWLMLAALHFDQVSAPDFGLRVKTPPLAATYIGGVLLAALLLGAIPYCEEFFRCLQVRRR